MKSDFIQKLKNIHNPCKKYRGSFLQKYMKTSLQAIQAWQESKYMLLVTYYVLLVVWTDEILLKGEIIIFTFPQTEQGDFLFCHQKWPFDYTRPKPAV